MYVCIYKHTHIYIFPICVFSLAVSISLLVALLVVPSLYSSFRGLTHSAPACSLFLTQTQFQAVVHDGINRASRVSAREGGRARCPQTHTLEACNACNACKTVPAREGGCARCPQAHTATLVLVYALVCAKLARHSTQTLQATQAHTLVLLYALQAFQATSVCAVLKRLSTAHTLVACNAWLLVYAPF